MSESFKNSNTAPKHIGNLTTLESASIHTGHNAAAFLAQVRLSRGYFPPDHKFNNPSYVAHVFWNNMRRAIELKRAAKALVPNITIEDWIKIRVQQHENKV